MKRTLGLLLFIATISSAQEPAAVFKSKAELVLLPVVVTRSGEPVTGLKATDFTLLHQGQREDIAVFEEITAAAPPSQASALPPRTSTNFGRGDAQSDTFIVLLDFLNARWDNAARMRAYIGDFAKLFADTNTRVAVLLLTPKGLVQAHSFTSDPADLLKAVETWSKKQHADPLAEQTGLGWTSTYSATSMTGTTDVLDRLAVSPNYSDRRKLDRAIMTTQALEQVSAAFGGIPGRKRLVWVSTGFPTVGDITAEPSRASTEFAIHEKIVRAWQSLTTNNIVVYPIDSNGGPVNPAFDPGSVPNTASMLEVAARTGGRTCVDLLNDCIKRTLAADRQYYLLGFYLRGDQKPGWHKLKVELREQKAEIHTRTGFVVGESEPNINETDRDIVLTALASTLDYTGVPLTLRWADAPLKDNSRQIELELATPPGGVVIESTTGRLDLDYLAFVRPIGKTDGQSYPKTITAIVTPERQKVLAEKGFLFRKQIPITPGEYELKVFLRDNGAGKIGTVSTTVSIK